MFFHKRGSKSNEVTQKVKCENCRQMIDRDMNSCPYCGYRDENIKETGWTCPKCGSKNPDDKIFCKDCGSVK